MSSDEEFESTQDSDSDFIAQKRPSMKRQPSEDATASKNKKKTTVQVPRKQLQQQESDDDFQQISGGRSQVCAHIMDLCQFTFIVMHVDG